MDQSPTVSILTKWYNWIMTGQMQFRKEHMIEAYEALKAEGVTILIDPEIERKARPSQVRPGG